MQQHAPHRRSNSTTQSRHRRSSSPSPIALASSGTRLRRWWVGCGIRRLARHLLHQWRASSLTASLRSIGRRRVIPARSSVRRCPSVDQRTTRHSVRFKYLEVAGYMRRLVRSYQTRRADETLCDHPKKYAHSEHARATTRHFGSRIGSTYMASLHRAAATLRGELLRHRCFTGIRGGRGFPRLLRSPGIMTESADEAHLSMDAPWRLTGDDSEFGFLIPHSQESRRSGDA